MLLPGPESISKLHLIILEAASLGFTVLVLLRLLIGEIRSIIRLFRRNRNQPRPEPMNRIADDK
jgi:hypothetical protein